MWIEWNFKVNVVCENENVVLGAKGKHVRLNEDFLVYGEGKPGELSKEKKNV